MSKVIVSKEKESLIINFFTDHTLSETALEFGLSTSVISRILKNNNVSNHPGSCRRVLSADEKQFIADNFNIYSDSFFMHKFKIHKKHYIMILNELNLSLRTHEENVELGKNKSEKTCLEKYGCKNPFQSEDIKNKMRETWLEKYGTEYATQSDNVKEKTKETCLEKYGVEYSLQSEEVKEKKRNTCLEKYGVECFLQTTEAREKLTLYMSEHAEEVREKINTTNIEKYGYKAASSSTEVKQKILQTQTEHYGDLYVNTEEFKAIKAEKMKSSIEKAAITNLERYGNENYFCTNDFKHKLYNTKKKNNSFHTSKIEENTYLLLCNILGANNIIRQYSDDRYPFACDFYVSDRDLFIELNITWTHGGKHFEESEQDLEKLRIWQKKAEFSDFYKNAITTWTVRDVEKMKLAKNNKLNYICLYSEEEIKE